MSAVKITIKHFELFDHEYKIVYVDNKPAYKTTEHDNIIKDQITSLLKLYNPDFSEEDVKVEEFKRIN